MLAAIKEFGSYLITLLVDTLRVYWRLFPQLTTLQLIGWIGTSVVLHISSVIAGRHPWVALFIFSTAFLWKLAPIILQLRLIGEYLSVRAVLPEDHPVDDRDDGIGRLLALTLLPFLGIYAAFGYTNAMAGRLVTFSLAQTGIFDPGNNVLSRLTPHSLRELWLVMAVVAGAYTVRRLLDLVHDATDLRFFGLLAALCEGFFMLGLLLSGGHVLRVFADWLALRAVSGWWGTFLDGLANTFALIKINLPEVLVVVGTLLVQTVWPFVAGVLARPVMWLAVASLVYGAHMLSVAEVWSKGERPSDAVAKLTRAQRRRAARQSSGTLRRAWLEFQEIFLGDIDDKYVPSFQSLRMILRAGLAFLAAFVFLYTVVEFALHLEFEAVLWLIGGHTQGFWLTWDPLVTLAGDFFQPLRVALLAVAFRQAMLLLRARSKSEQQDLGLTDDEAVKVW